MPTDVAKPVMMLVAVIFLVMAIVSAIFMITILATATFAGVMTSTIAMSSLYQFNFRTLKWNDYLFIAKCSYIVHAIFLFIGSLIWPQYSVGHIAMDAIAAAGWPFAIIMTNEGGLAGYPNLNIVIAGLFFVTVMITSYGITYKKYVFGVSKDGQVRKRLYFGGLGMFFGVILIPLYFLGIFAQTFIHAQAFDWSKPSILSNNSSKQNVSAPLIETNIDFKFKGSRMRSYGEGNNQIFKVPGKVKYMAIADGGRMGYFHTVGRNGHEFHVIFDFKTGKETTLLKEWLLGNAPRVIFTPDYKMMLMLGHQELMLVRTYKNDPSKPKGFYTNTLIKLEDEDYFYTPKFDETLWQMSSGTMDLKMNRRNKNTGKDDEVLAFMAERCVCNAGF